jgi:hypothetical protein
VIADERIDGVRVGRDKDVRGRSRSNRRARSPVAPKEKTVVAPVFARNSRPRSVIASAVLAAENEEFRRPILLAAVR